MNLFKTLAMVGLVGMSSVLAQQTVPTMHGSIGSQLKNVAILNVDLRKIICNSLPDYDFVAGDHKMSVGTLTTTSRIPKEGFIAVGANCILKAKDKIDTSRPTELTEILSRAMRRPCGLSKNITYAEETSRFLGSNTSDIPQNQFGQNWITDYTLNSDGTINHSFFLLQVTQLPNREIEVTIFYSEATTPQVNPSEPSKTP